MASKLEDSWAFVPIGHPFPQFPVRVKGEQNMYVALWYKHGKPVCGRAWNDGGVVQCSFPYNGTELTGINDLGGQIQILTYKGDYDSNGFCYEWIPYKLRHEPHVEIVHCADSTPILMNSNKAAGTLVGNLDLSTEKASISWGGKEEAKLGGVQEQLVICRNRRRPEKKVWAEEQGEEDAEEAKRKKYSWGALEEDHWVDVRCKDPFPANAFRALGRPLRLEDGTSADHFVALWYKHGEPVMGRCWQSGLQIFACFGWDGKEFSGDVGSFQVRFCLVSQF